MKAVAAYRGGEKVKARLLALLRGSAQLWYTSSLEQLTKNSLRHTPGLQQWTDILKTHFRQSPQEQLSALSSLRYTYRDAMRHRPFVRYVAEMQRHARNAGFLDTTIPLKYAYRGLDKSRSKFLSPCIHCFNRCGDYELEEIFRPGDRADGFPGTCASMDLMSRRIRELMP